MDQYPRYKPSQTILNSLRDLSEDRAAYLQDGTKVESLLFDSGRNDDDSLLGLYFTTMMILLEWGIRKSLNYASMSSPSLWDSMVIIDGLRGYNVRYVWVWNCAIWQLLILFISAIPRLYVSTLNYPNITKPKILAPKEQKTIQSFIDNVDYIPDFLRGESTARAVVATRCQCGWPKLSIAAICLYVDAGNLTNIEPSLTNQVTPAVIIRAKLKHAVDNVTRATELITQGLGVV